VFQCLYTSGVARGGGGFNPPHSHQSRFFHSRKVAVIKYYNLSLTTRRTINSHDLRKTNHLGSVIASTVECVLTWIREQYLVVCNIAKRTILCTVVHFQPVIKLHQKGVRVHHRRVILMEKMLIFSGEGAQPPLPSGEVGPPAHTPTHRRLDHSEILPTLLLYTTVYVATVNWDECFSVYVQGSMWQLSTARTDSRSVASARPSVAASMYRCRDLLSPENLTTSLVTPVTVDHQ